MQAERGKEGDIVTREVPGPGSCCQALCVCPVRLWGVTGWETLWHLWLWEASFSHIPSWPVLGGDSSFLEGKMRLPRPRFTALTCIKCSFAPLCWQCGLQGGCEHRGGSVVRRWNTQTPVAPSALPLSPLLISLPIHSHVVLLLLSVKVPKLLRNAPRTPLCPCGFPPTPARPSQYSHSPQF